jgi:hypothetical protein
MNSPEEIIPSFGRASLGFLGSLALLLALVVGLG